MLGSRVTQSVVRPTGLPPSGFSTQCGVAPMPASAAPAAMVRPGVAPIPKHHGVFQFSHATAEVGGTFRDKATGQLWQAQVLPTVDRSGDLDGNGDALDYATYCAANAAGARRMFAQLSGTLSQPCRADAQEELAVQDVCWDMPGEAQKRADAYVVATSRDRHPANYVDREELAPMVENNGQPAGFRGNYFMPRWIPADDGKPQPVLADPQGTAVMPDYGDVTAPFVARDTGFGGARAPIMRILTKDKTSIHRGTPLDMPAANTPATSGVDLSAPTHAGPWTHSIFTRADMPDVHQQSAVVPAQSTTRPGVHVAAPSHAAPDVGHPTRGTMVAASDRRMQPGIHTIHHSSSLALEHQGRVHEPVQASSHTTQMPTMHASTAADVCWGANNAAPLPPVYTTRAGVVVASSSSYIPGDAVAAPAAGLVYAKQPAKRFMADVAPGGRPEVGLATLPGAPVYQVPAKTPLFQPGPNSLASHDHSTSFTSPMHQVKRKGVTTSTLQGIGPDLQLPQAPFGGTTFVRDAYFRKEDTPLPTDTTVANTLARCGPDVGKMEGHGYVAGEVPRTAVPCRTNEPLATRSAFKMIPKMDKVSHDGPRISTRSGYLSD